MFDEELHPLWDFESRSDLIGLDCEPTGHPALLLVALRRAVRTTHSSQASYLDRHGLLLLAERRLTKIDLNRVYQ
jgi:hypothetical protein